MKDTVKILEERLSHIKTPITLSIIGCVVNGPGEAAYTDIGITGGGGNSNMLYLKGLQNEKISNDVIVSKVVSLVEQKVKELGVNITIHAGEGDGVNSIIDALDNGAMRIGHGVRIIEDIYNNIPGETAKKIIEQQIPLEICITSNIHTNMYENFDSHPIVDLIALGFNVYLNTDNRLMSNTSISKELEIAKSLGIENVENLLKYSASDSFFD
jgi:hypothetical protein